MRPFWTEWATLSGIVFVLSGRRPGRCGVEDNPAAVVDELLGRYGEKRFVFCDDAGRWRELLHTGITYRGMTDYEGLVPGVANKGEN